MTASKPKVHGSTVANSFPHGRPSSVFSLSGGRRWWRIASVSSLRSHNARKKKGSYPTTFSLFFKDI